MNAQLMELEISNARVDVDNFFENLINKIDLEVELFISENIEFYHDQSHPHFAKINEWREACIVEIRACKDHNLALINSETAQLPFEQRIKRFCFLASFMDTVYNSANPLGHTLISTDKYLTKAEITCFETLAKFLPGAELDEAINREKYQTDRAEYIKSVDELFVRAERNSRNAVSDKIIFCKNHKVGLGSKSYYEESLRDNFFCSSYVQ
jgi:hypothetical protein